MAQRYAIDDVELNAATRELWRDGLCIPVEPQVFDLLLLLIENRERIVSKNELVERIWQGRAISDAALSSCVKAARRALGDDGQRQRMVRTIHRRGFRFVGPVGVLEISNPTPVIEATIAAPSLSEPTEDCLCHLPEPCACGGYEEAATLTLPAQPSIAVLPFQAWGDDHGRLMAEGLHRDVTVEFARTRWLFVSARASVQALAACGYDPTEVSGRLGVRYLLDGACVFANGRVRITVTLTDALRRCEIWAEHYERKIDDVFEVQNEIVDSITRAVESEIEGQERRRALLRPPASLDAWGAYHRALTHLYRFREVDHEAAAEYLHLAKRLDPTMPRVFSALSFLHWQRAFLDVGEDRDEDIARALDYAHQSVELDPLEPQGHWVLGRARYLQGEFDLGVAEVRRSIELNPSFAQAQYSLALRQMTVGDSSDGFRAVDRARRLSPYDPMTFAFSAVRGKLLALSGQVEAGADWADRAVREPNAHHHVTAIAVCCNELAGRRDRALQHLTKLKEVRPDYSRDDYFQSFRLQGQGRILVETAFARLGL